MTKSLRKTSSKEERQIGFTILEVSLHGCLDLQQGTQDDRNEVGQSCLCHGNQRVKKKGRAKTPLSLVQGYSRSHSEMGMRKSFCVLTCLSVSYHTWPLNPIVTGVLIANDRHKGSSTQR